MGDKNEKPVHRVTINEFFMGKTEVTQSLWKAVMGNNPSEFKGDNLPVEQVSWSDVQEFFKNLNSVTGKKYRLPTEAEWEYAAGGGSDNRTKWAGTDQETAIDNYVWNVSNSEGQTHEVAIVKANSLGLYDMCGNVWEWCSDWYNDYSPGEQFNPIGSTSGMVRVIRGGCWSNSAFYCRSVNRDSSFPDNNRSNLGFRIVLAP